MSKSAPHRQTEKQFSLKDELFNDTTVRQLAAELKAVYPDFNAQLFTHEVLRAFPEQELMERIRGIRNALRTHLPDDYRQAVAIILAALPPPLDPARTDNDFGSFIYAPYSYFVATYGCSKRHVAFSLRALREITKRFSAEAALRDFLNAFPKETTAAVTTWSTDANYHVRRLASEGTRPYLPWAQRLSLPPATFVPILDTLYADHTRYVTRSVANHLNDLSKIDPDLVVRTLKRWQKEDRQSPSELAFITKHALRTLIKTGHQEALALLGYDAPKIKSARLTLASPTVTIGKTLGFTLSLTAAAAADTQSLLVDYVVHYQKANGTTAPKVFKLGTYTVEPGDRLSLQKEHSFKLMSTRALYPGKHQLVVQVNGVPVAKKQFTLSS
jgi:3-methyladenine DNA glycosylase AlkC